MRRHWSDQDGADAPSETRYCVDAGCAGGSWQTRADGRIPEIWHISTAEGGSYRIAAHEPICPRCGGELALHPEGTGTAPGTENNPFVGFLQVLNKAEVPGV